jgi:hypothetical protein
MHNIWTSSLFRAMLMDNLVGIKKSDTWTWKRNIRTDTNETGIRT